VLVFAIIGSLSACFLFEHETRLTVPETSPVDIRLGCALAESRCTRCHTVDRILNARVDSPSHWRDYVHRMRLQPQSGILPDEESPILHCLVYRSFGSPGVTTLDNEVKP
jgi:hypothetical protein